MALLEWLVLQENLHGWKKGHRQRTTLSLYSPLLRVPCALVFFEDIFEFAPLGYDGS